MKALNVNTRTTEIVVSLGFIALAAIVARETIRLGAGWGSSGPQPGFFPLISVLLMAAGAIVVLVQAIRRGAGRPLFESRDEAVSMLKVGIPLAAAVASVQYLGLYLMTALYMAFFTAWYGRYRWFVAVAAGLLLPVVLFLAFERGFKLSLPKSMFYGDLIPF